MSKLMRNGLFYLTFTGLLVHLFVAYGFWGLQRAEHLSARQVLVKATEQLNIDNPILTKLLAPDIKYLNFPFDGEIKSTHPRILLPELSNWNNRGVHSIISDRIDAFKRENIYYSNGCGDNSLMPAVVCWLSTNNTDAIADIKRQLLNFELNKPTADTTYSNGWELALAYDLAYPLLTDAEKNQVEAKILEALRGTLANLDEDFASLWHGRSTHAAIAWLCAIVLSEQYVDDLESYRRRAQAHFLNAAEGLAHTEAWPDGYNYWIQTRAFYFALAASAYRNGLDHANNQERIKDIVKRVGYWHIYATRPDNRIEGYGDEGSRIDLKDETKRVIDLMVQMTHDPVLNGYAKYLGKLHRDSYYSGYAWGILLFNDPSIPAVGDGTLASLGKYLKEAEIFGRDTVNQIYIRNGWEPNDTFISFKAGNSYGHHAHYDAGHFTIFKSSPLITNSSTYNGFFRPHRLNYAIRTLAKNSLIIEKPNEKVRPNRFFAKNVADGGQRLTQPTGSSIVSIEQWFENYQKGLHLEGAQLLKFARRNNEYVFVSADLTASYNNSVYDENGAGGKVRQVIRKLVYLPAEDKLVVYDTISKTKPEYVGKWIIHSVNKPEMADIKVLKGSADNGILESRSKDIQIKNNNGFLKVNILLPSDASTRLVGGRDYQYYVETDGDDTVFDGENFVNGSSADSWHDVSRWRAELLSNSSSNDTEFLVCLAPSVDKPVTEDVRKISSKNGNAHGVLTNDALIVFIRESAGMDDIVFDDVDKSKIILVGLPEYKNVSIRIGNKNLFQGTAKDGVVFYDNPSSAAGQVEIRMN